MNSFSWRGGAILSAVSLAPSLLCAQQIIEEIHVTGVPLEQSAAELAQSVTVLRDESLDRIRSGNLGETLANQLGVSASYFGAGASRPIVRGLAGARVRIMEDGIDAMDVSTVSADHAVGVDPLVAEQIEIFRGPTTLLYGSGAVGGVVNTVTRRIPEEAPSDGIEAVIDLRYDSVSSGTSAATKLDGGSDRFAWHFDAHRQDAGDYDVPGFSAANGTSDRLDNSSLDSESAAAGASWLGDNGYLGASLNSFASNYGIPNRALPAETIRIDLEQNRFDLKGGWLGLGGPITAVNLRIGVNDYRHVEFESGVPGTRFENDAHESRVELMHRSIGEWRGAVGLQFGQRRFAAIGSEAFVPPIDAASVGAFIVEQRDIDRWNLSLGARMETRDLTPDNGLPKNRARATSFSAAGLRRFENGYTLALNFASADRLPVAEELYSDGPHLASGTIEIGDPSLGKETSRHFDIGIRKTAEQISWSLTSFFTDFDNFIYLRNTGNVDPIEALPIFRWDRAKVAFRGFEAELFMPIARAGAGEIDLRIFADSVRAALSGGSPLPRIPPMRFGARLQYHSDKIVAGLDTIRYAKQHRTAGLEQPTPGYTMLNADVNWQIETPSGRRLNAYIRAGNLLDEVARRHSSLVKDIAPLPGRNIALGFRAEF